MTTTPLTRLPATACEDDDHRFAGHCTTECARLAEMMQGDGYSEPMIYGDYLGGESTIDWSGTHRGPELPEQAVEYDEVNRAVVLVLVHPEGCSCPDHPVCDVPGCDWEAVSTLDSPDPGGTMDVCERHARPGICQNIHSVSDDAFGYWNSAWGHPPVHEFPCTNPATVEARDPWDGEVYHLCTDCAK